MQKIFSNSSQKVIFLFLSLGISFIFRLPYLINPDQMNSDHAIFGLQALHILKNEWSFFLWGCYYQGILEPLIAAIFFKFFGPHFIILALVPFTGYVLTILLLYSIFTRVISPLNTFLLLLPVLVGSKPFIQPSVLPFRQWSLLCAFLPFFFLSLPNKKKWSRGAAGFFVFFALYADFFTVVFILPSLSLIYFSVKNKNDKVYCGIGALTGLLFLLFTRLFAKEGAPLAFSFKTFLKNIPLFFQTCLPITLGSPYSSHHSIFILFFGILFASVLSWGFWLGVKEKNNDPLLFRFSLFGGLLFFSTLLGFFGSSMASDVHSSRYLITLYYAAPFCLFYFFKKRSGWIILFLLFFTLIVGVGGWKQAAPLTHSFRIIRDPNQTIQTAYELKEWLQRNKINGGYINYWDSYALTFLFQEEIILAPLTEDRYPPYSKKIQQLPKYALVFTPKDSEEKRKEILSTFATLPLEKWEKNGYLALIFSK